MKLVWLEDFFALVEAGSFSEAARRRNVTQPAFSRRIQMLEQWLGVELFDRNHRQPTPLPAAVRLEPELRRVVERLYELRSQLQAESVLTTHITLAAQHTLMVSHLPRLLRDLEERESGLVFRARAGNHDDCLNQLYRRDADVAICFEDPLAAPGTSWPQFERIALGRDRLYPVIAAEPVVDFQRMGETGRFRWLGYPDNTFLGRIVRQQCLPEVSRRYRIELVCESSLTLGIKEMVLAGMGIARLLTRLIEKELLEGDLQPLTTHLPAPDLTVALYRLVGTQSRECEAFWRLLQMQPAAWLDAVVMPSEWQES